MLEQGTYLDVDVLWQPQSGCPLATCEIFEAPLKEMLYKAIVE